MIQIIVHVIVTAFLLTVVARLIDGIDVKNGKAALIAAIVFGLINASVGKLLFILTFPVTLLTLGLFLIVINAAMLMLAAKFVDGFAIRNFKTALWGAVALSVLNWLVTRIF